jgi:putative membrane protein insertion efficiency factor
MRDFALFLWLAPRNVIIALLKVYRFAISPLYGDVCKFYPSCSCYGLDAITDHGVIRGSALTLRRLGRCHPWALGGVDDVPPCEHKYFHRTKHGFVAPSHLEGRH